MQSLPTSGSRITTTLRSTNNPLVQRFLGGSTTSKTSEQLAVLENILADVAQVVPQVIEQATDTLNVPQAVGSARNPELAAATTPDIAPELAGHMQAVEQEPSPELSPEVEGYLEAVENYAEQQPQEVVIADGTLPTNHSNLPAKKVVVLPITEEVTKVARHKNPTWSIKWLVSWSERLMKMFQGSVVYRSPE
ncbi:MAG: hypothetical protein GW947_03670 [Candidatus Pacebacteria bacterium]|nr:hypothetical protein [Candidatus Paceibacterota bacterium]PIR61163.1 MAG: hypothetical protein COU68_00860 [Candidatus Pacebacteria bacterium CG10_big_fil_rev_8_21_14_0_10_45_6]